MVPTCLEINAEEVPYEYTSWHLFLRHFVGINQVYYEA